jgi:DNA modification methylase
MIKQMKKIGDATLYCADCKDVLPLLKDIDACVTDPPYGLSFMGKAWDYDVPGTDIWTQVHDVLKPGAHLLSFFGSRTYHRGAIPIEDAGFEIRDQLMWLYGSGFPKSHNIGKAIDKRGGASIGWFGSWFRSWREENSITQKQVAALFPSKTGSLTGCVANWELGLNLPTPEQFNLICKTFGLPFASIKEAEREVVGTDTKARSSSGASALPTVGGKTEYKTWDITASATPEAKQWEGWGTALKPAHEPIVMARKPFKGSVAENVLQHGTGGINIDECRVETDDKLSIGSNKRDNANVNFGMKDNKEEQKQHEQGRFPANVMHDGSEVVQDVFGDKSRYFYCAKASKKDRDEGLDMVVEKAMAWGNQAKAELKRGNIDFKADGDSTKHNQVQMRKNNHPTVKPTELMRYLCRLVTPQGGVVLDPFMGSGSTGKAAIMSGYKFIGIEMSEEYFELACARVEAAQKERGLF